MGSDLTPDYGLSAALIPRKWSATYASDFQSGTDYTEASRKVGRVEYDGNQASRIALRLTGDPDSTLTDAHQFRTTRGGAPGYDGAAQIYRYGDSGDWFGHDPPEVIAGYDHIDSEGLNEDHAFSDSVINPLTGTPLVYYTNTNATTTRLFTASWTDGSGWGTPSNLGLSYEGTTPMPVAACVAPDGAIHVYWGQQISGTAAYKATLWRRSPNGGSTKFQSSNIGVGLNSNTTHLKAITHVGAVALFTGDTDSQQFISTDGGYTFTSVASANSNARVLALVSHAGYLLALTCEGASGVAYIRRISSASQDLWSTERVQVSATCDPDAGGMMWVCPDGVYMAVLSTSSTMYETLAYTLDAGATVSIAKGPINNADTVIAARGSAIYHQGEAHIIGLQTNASNGTITAASNLVDMILGGNTQVTCWGNQDGTRSPRTASFIESFTPILDLADTSFSSGTDTGAPTRVRTATNGTLITTVGGEEAQNDYSATASGIKDADFTVKAQVTAGSVEFIVDARPISVTCTLTSTQVTFGETGGSGTTRPHLVTGAIELKIKVDGSAQEASVWWRESDLDDEREWTTPTTVTSFSTTSITAIAARMHVQASSTVRLHWGSFRNATVPPSGALGGGVESDGSNLRPLSMTATIPAWVGSGISMTLGGGPARFDGNTYTTNLDGGKHARRNVLPHIAPSPRRVWRSDGDSTTPVSTTQTLKFTLNPDQPSNLTKWTSDAVGIFLDNLVGVPKIIVKNDGSAVQTCDLRTSYSYVHDDGVIEPAEAASTVDGPYVVGGSLRGQVFEFANGQTRIIADNTGGVLTSGSTVAEKRCILRLEGLDGTEDSTGTGYIWPKRALLVYYCRGDAAFKRLDLEMNSSDPVGPEGYRQIGVAAVGELAFFGRAFDRTHSLEVEANNAMTQADDGSSFVTPRGPIGSTIELAFVESPTFLDGPRSGGSIPYVTVSDDASADPVAARYGVPMQVQGVYQRLNGSELPCVPLRRVPRDVGGDRIYVATIGRGTLADGARLCRMMNTVRREQIQVGEALVSDGERVATLTFRTIE